MKNLTAPTLRGLQYKITNLWTFNCKMIQLRENCENIKDQVLNNVLHLKSLELTENPLLLVFWNTALILNNCSNSTSTNQLKDNKQCANLHSHPSQEFVRLQYSQLSKSSLLQSASSSPWHKPNIIKSLRYTLFQNLSAISNYM